MSEMLRRKECETPKERAQPCLEVGMQMRSGVGVDAWKWWRGFAAVVAWLRGSGGGAGVGAR